MGAQEWTLPGAEGLPIRGESDPPDGAPRGVALVVHGFTGNRNRNIIPVVSAHLASIGLLSHRFTLSHAGVGDDGDSITRPDEFERDSLAFCLQDIRAVVGAVADGRLGERGLPLVLVGHSRGGAQVLRAAALALRERWPIDPAAVIALAATATYTRLTPEIERQLCERGYVERECARATGGTVRLGRSWYEHHLDNPGRDLFAEDLAELAGPVLVVHGRDDASVQFGHAERICEMLSANESVRLATAFIEGADHNFNALGIGPRHENADNPCAVRLKQAVTGFLAGVLP